MVRKIRFLRHCFGLLDLGRFPHPARSTLSSHHELHTNYFHEDAKQSENPQIRLSKHICYFKKNHFWQPPFSLDSKHMFMHRLWYWFPILPISNAKWFWKSASIWKHLDLSSTCIQGLLESSLSPSVGEPMASHNCLFPLWNIDSKSIWNLSPWLTWDRCDNSAWCLGPMGGYLQ